MGGEGDGGGLVVVEGEGKDTQEHTKEGWRGAGGGRERERERRKGREGAACKGGGGRRREGLGEGGVVREGLATRTVERDKEGVGKRYAARPQRQDCTKGRGGARVRRPPPAAGGALLAARNTPQREGSGGAVVETSKKKWRCANPYCAAARDSCALRFDCLCWRGAAGSVQTCRRRVLRPCLCCTYSHVDELCCFVGPLCSAGGPDSSSSAPLPNHPLLR